MTSSILTNSTFWIGVFFSLVVVYWIITGWFKHLETMKHGWKPTSTSIEEDDDEDDEDDDYDDNEKKVGEFKIKITK